MNEMYYKSFRKIFIHFNPEIKSKYNNIIKPQIANVDTLFHFLNETNYDTYNNFFISALEQYTIQCYYVKLNKQVHKESRRNTQNILSVPFSNYCATSICITNRWYKHWYT